jgi:hypothetical protein
VLDYADYVGNNELKELVKRGCEYGRSEGVPPVGFFPDSARQQGILMDGQRRPGPNLVCSEFCSPADAVTLAV